MGVCTPCVVLVGVSSFFEAWVGVCSTVIVWVGLSLFCVVVNIAWISSMFEEVMFWHLTVISSVAKIQYKKTLKN